MDILIDKENAGKNIRQLLRGDLGYSSGMLKRLKFSEGGILVNGQFQTVRYELKEGDILSVACEDKHEDTSPYITPVPLNIGIAYEDKSLTVVDKPHSMPAHPSFGHREDTVANALAYRYGDKPYVFRPVNRLDRDTSGLMITANTRLAAFKLYQSMIGGDIKKAYIAVLDGKPPSSDGIITAYMGRCDDSIVKRRICDENDPDAKIAVTAYRLLLENNGHSVVVASPVTGRTHQLRLHFSSLGCPVTGDTMYGNENSLILRHALHSAYTSFTHPESGRLLKLRSRLPDDMSRLLGERVKNDIENRLEYEIELLMKQNKNHEKN